MEAAYAETSRYLDPRELAVESIWLIGRDSGRPHRRIGSASLPPGGRRIAAAPTAARRSIADPLYVRHHRPVEGRVLSTGTILLVGRQ